MSAENKFMTACAAVCIAAMTLFLGFIFLIG